MFLYKLPDLELAMIQAGEEVLNKGVPFIRTLQAFSNIVETCFSNELKPGYESAIEEFRLKYLNLGISVTPKVIKM